MSSSRFGDTDINLIRLYKIMTERRTSLSVQTGPFFRHGYAILMDIAWQFFHPIHKYTVVGSGYQFVCGEDKSRGGCFILEWLVSVFVVL